MIPYEEAFTLIGTTDLPWSGDPASPSIDDAEIAYLCAGVNRYLADPVGPQDVVHSYSGIRALHDDGAASASKVTRDYLLRLDTDAGPPLLSVFGGKITTYRRLAEETLERLGPFFPELAPPWTASRPLPGGDLPGGDLDGFVNEVMLRWSFLPPRIARRLARAYGTRIAELIGDAQSLDDLGEDFGGGLSVREVDYLVAREWARTAEDLLWRRSKLGLHLKPDSVERLSAYLESTVKLPDHAHG
jgi:glycerol-3-phosphate dehydrogenase